MKQQKAIALLLQLLAARPQRRKELMKQQFSFVAVIRGEEAVVGHGEFFLHEEVPFHEVGKTTEGVVFRNLVTGATAFIPFEEAEGPAVAPAAPAVVPAVPAPAVTVVVTRTMRVSFGEKLEFWSSTFSEKLEITAPSSGAVIEEVRSDGKIEITFLGLSRETWTI